MILAFNLYTRTPFGRIHQRNPEIVRLAGELGRTPGALSYKLANFARLDPTLQARGIRGMEHGSRAEAEIWEEFAADPESLAFESERLLAELRGTTLEDQEPALPEVDAVDRAGLVRLRVGQGFFRRMVLARYGGRCCVTGLAVPELLVASHIVPWSVSPGQRMNPRNALCLNALHDRAFDRGLITVTPDYVVRVSPAIEDRSEPAARLLHSLEGARLRLPPRFAPDPELLAYHNQEVFRR